MDFLGLWLARRARMTMRDFSAGANRTVGWSLVLVALGLWPHGDRCRIGVSDCVDHRWFAARVFCSAC